MHSLGTSIIRYDTADAAERAELIAVIVRLAGAHEQALDLADCLLLDIGLSDSERANARSLVARWREQLTASRVRVATLLDQRPQ